jgi:predicted DCC family thiol-disulfide oxidoreductase YuxK
MDRKGRIRFTDIAAADFHAAAYALAIDEFMSEIHGRLRNGTWIRGVEVFRQLYSAVGWTPVVRVTRLPIVAGLLDGLYRLFARNRLRLTGRCKMDGTSCGNDSGDATPMSRDRAAGLSSSSSS